jgi:hypothetical protein
MPPPPPPQASSGAGFCDVLGEEEARELDAPAVGAVVNVIITPPCIFYIENHE